MSHASCTCHAPLLDPKTRICRVCGLVRPVDPDYKGD